jgi:hypothetical protein
MIIYIPMPMCIGITLLFGAGPCMPVLIADGPPIGVKTFAPMFIDAEPFIIVG